MPCRARRAPDFCTWGVAHSAYDRNVLGPYTVYVCEGFPVKGALQGCLTAVAVLCCAAGTTAQPPPVVVELFTSQGCSSWPPADAYLGRLSRRSEILALAFHVDYWDSLGWRDRFALSQSVERQNVYARNLHRLSVYTPQLVIDGRDDAVGSDASALVRALGKPRDGAPVALAVHDAEVRIEISARADLPDSDVVLVAYLRHAVSAVGRGENAGRTLEEFNIVSGIRVLGRSRGETWRFRVAVSSLPPDATDVAVLVQPSGQGPIIGAAAHALH